MHGVRIYGDPGARTQTLVQPPAPVQTPVQALGKRRLRKQPSTGVARIRIGSCLCVCLRVFVCVCMCVCVCVRARARARVSHVYTCVYAIRTLITLSLSHTHTDFRCGERARRRVWRRSTWT